MLDACSRCNFIREGACLLYDHQTNRSLELRQLAVGPRTDPTGIAMFEDYCR